MYFFERDFRPCCLCHFPCTGKSFLEALILASTNVTTIWQNIVHWITSSIHENYKLRTSGEHGVPTNYVFDFVLTFRTIYVHIMFSWCSELVVFMYWTSNSMNNLSLYCGLVHARIRASDKDLPVHIAMVTVTT